jgi:photosystem II stability/assembly factor-like uncharacterized protein
VDTAFLGDNVSMVLHDARDGTLYAALEHGHFGAKLHRTRDRGKSWEECVAPSYPPKPEGLEDLDPVRKTPILWSLQRVWSLEPGGTEEPGLLWCGTIPGGLFRSDDGGSSWKLVESLWHREERTHWFGGGAEYPGIHSICVDPRDSRRVTVGVSCGGVWRTRDGGETWELGGEGMQAPYMPPAAATDANIQDPHRIVQCAAEPDVFWCQHHSGIYRSTDDCHSWQSIKNVPPSVFGFAVAVHPADADTAWFVPAIKDEKRIPVDGRVVVTRTRNGAQNFEVLTQGLPQEHAYDLVYRHGLDVDENGDRLAFGSTTGSLWVSEDGGDHWMGVSTHLPPIHCVRFA